MDRKKAAGPSRKILVVDDDQAVRKMLSLLLESTCEVLLASSGEEGLRLVAAERPRLMLLDLVMPGMGGLEVLTAARAISPAMTVIMLTGKTDMDLARKALELGAVEFVTKPFDMASLKEKVGRSLETLSADDRNNHGLPWRVVEPDAPAAAARDASAPSEESLARWEGEGGDTDRVEIKT
jgi:DNA-binding NtrC family response regulator